MRYTALSMRRIVFALAFVTLLALAGFSAGTRYAQADGQEEVFLPVIFGVPEPPGSIPVVGQ